MSIPRITTSIWSPCSPTDWSPDPNKATKIGSQFSEIYSDYNNAKKHSIDINKLVATRTKQYHNSRAFATHVLSLAISISNSEYDYQVKQMSLSLIQTANKFMLDASNISKSAQVLSDEVSAVEDLTLDILTKKLEISLDAKAPEYIPGKM
uniref:Uncharacterized protein n=1 Tax=Megaviridae environmental sample TaxID=1737588 RepID=A0A5J6VJ11_9VIRU|nr:MAG: hypothetical protein [Megaviridae environmental sample]